MFCKYCGKELANDVKFCSNCGKQLFHDSLDLQGETKEGPISANDQLNGGVEMQSFQVKSAEQNCNVVEEKSVNTKKFCENCGEQLIDGAKFCLACGSPVSTSISVEEHINQNGQQPVNRISQFETKNNPASYNPTQSSKSRLVAALLAFFLGEFGAHRFYVGKKSSAIWQIIFGFSFFIALICMAGDFPEAGIFFLILGLVLVVWILVDFIMILCGSFKDKDDLPLVNWDF